MSNLEEWAHDRLTVVGRSGNEIVAECPWCDRPKLYVSVKRKRFICFRGCDQGAAFRLVAHVDGVTLKAAKEKLDRAPRTAGELFEILSRLRRGKREASEPPSIPLPAEFIPCFDGEWWRLPRYLDTRDLSDEAVIRHGLGYCRGGRYRDRLIVPVVYGDYRSFVARLMGSPAARSWVASDGRTITPMPYLMPKDAEIGRALYWGSHIEPGDDVLVVEGVFDAIRLLDLGFAAVATFGKQASASQLRDLVKSGARSLTWVYDADAVAYGAAEAAKAAAAAATRDLSVYVVEMPDGYDPDDYGRDHGRPGIEGLLADRVEVGRTLEPLRLALARLYEAPIRRRRKVSFK